MSLWIAQTGQDWLWVTLMVRGSLPLMLFWTHGLTYQLSVLLTEELDVAIGKCTYGMTHDEYVQIDKRIDFVQGLVQLCMFGLVWLVNGAGGFEFVRRRRATTQAIVLPPLPYVRWLFGLDAYRALGSAVWIATDVGESFEYWFAVFPNFVDLLLLYFGIIDWFALDVRLKHVFGRIVARVAFWIGIVAIVVIKMVIETADRSPGCTNDWSNPDNTLKLFMFTMAFTWAFMVIGTMPPLPPPTAAPDEEASGGSGGVPKVIKVL